jgi:branched-chain amino acid transport system substrate-binding protein
MRSGLRLTLFAALLCWAAVGVSAVELLDDRPEILSEYAKARKLLLDGHYLEASRQFAQLAERYPDSKNLDLFVFNHAKAELYFGNRSDALVIFADFINRFPGSSLLAYAYFFEGNAYYLKAQVSQAVAAYIDAFRLSNDVRLDNMINGSLAEAVLQAQSVALGEADFSSLDPVRRCQLIEPIAQALEKRTDTTQARGLRAICAGHREATDSSAVMSLNADLELALLVPLSGELQTFGEAIFRGATIGAEQFHRNTGRRLRLVPYDTKGNAIDAARLVRELVHTHTDAVIGPLTSEETAVTAAALSCDFLPLITPAATQAGLTLLSESTFQLSPNIELQGIRAAEYAVLKRGAKTAAVMTPTTADQLRMAGAFEDRFKALGGTIVATEYYRPRDRDFGQYVRDLKAVLLGHSPDSAAYIDDRGDTLDIEAVPANLDCLYLPGSAEQLRLLLPQLKFHSIETFYLGSDGWGDDAVYRLGDDVTRLAVFPSPFLEQERSQEYVKFASEYDARYGEQPHRLAGLGYDAVKLIAQALQAGAVTRRDLVTRLSRVRGYAGAAAPITFGEHRENIELPMYQLIHGVPTLLGATADSAAVGTR